MIRDILGLKRSEYLRIAPELFAYLFNRIDMERFITRVGDRKEGTRIKDIARVNGYILKNCKLYAYAVHVARKKGETLPKARTFGVAPKDIKMLKSLNLKHLSPTFKAFSLEEYDATVNDMITSSEIKNYVGKFVSKKMAFLMRSYGETREDIEAYLKEMAIISVYKQYPRYASYLHFINVAKAQIHNKGQSFITSSTAKSRQKLILNREGASEAVHVSLEVLNDLAAPIAYGTEIKERLQALSQLEHLFPERTKEFLMCVSGQYHEGFSEFLKCSNDIVVESMGWPKYMDKVQKYFDTTPERTERLFTKIRNRIHQVNI